MEPTTMDRPAMPGGALASTPVPETKAPAPAVEPPTLKLLSRDDLFGNRPRVTTEVVIAGYGRARVASLRQGQWEDLNARHQGEDGKTDTSKGYMNEAVAAALVQPDGSPMFEDPVEGAKQVRLLDLPVVNKLFAAVANQSGLTAEAREALGKTSEPTPSVGG
jgi:hypothetical protein